jgi:hypothetical protein
VYGFRLDRETNRSPWPTSMISQMAIDSDHLPCSLPRNRAAGLPSKWQRPIRAPNGGLRQYCQAPDLAKEDSASEGMQHELETIAGDAVEQVAFPEHSRCASPTPPPLVFPPSILLATLDELRREALSKKVPKGMPQDWQPSIGAHTVKHLVNSNPSRPLNHERLASRPGRTRRNAGCRTHRLARPCVETIYAPRNLQPWIGAPLNAWQK